MFLLITLLPSRIEPKIIQNCFSTSQKNRIVQLMPHHGFVCNPTAVTFGHRALWKPNKNQNKRKGLLQIVTQTIPNVLELAEETTLGLQPTVIPVLARDNCRNWPPLMIAVNQISVSRNISEISYCKNHQRIIFLFYSYSFLEFYHSTLALM